jgi:hypothetical protein
MVLLVVFCFNVVRFGFWFAVTGLLLDANLRQLRFFAIEFRDHSSRDGAACLEGVMDSVILAVLSEWHKKC